MAYYKTCLMHKIIIVWVDFHLFKLAQMHLSFLLCTYAQNSKVQKPMVGKQLKDWNEESIKTCLELVGLHPLKMN